MGKIEEKKRKKKEALLVSAFQLFTEKGIDNTSVSEIAMNAHMAKGTFYLYFKDKYEVQDCLTTSQANIIFENADANLSEYVANNVNHSFEDCIIYLVNNIIDQLNERPDILRFVSKNLSWGVFSNIRIAGLENKNCMDIFDSLIAKSKKKYQQKELMIYMIVELINSTCYNVILNHAPVELKELKEAIFKTVRTILKQFECC